MEQTVDGQHDRDGAGDADLEHGLDVAAQNGLIIPAARMGDRLGLLRVDVQFLRLDPPVAMAGGFLFTTQR